MAKKLKDILAVCVIRRLLLHRRKKQIIILLAYVAYLINGFGELRMGLVDKLYGFRDYFIMGGLAIAIINFLGFLPEELPIAGDLSNYIYVAVAALGMFLYHRFYWGKAKMAPSFARSVASRNISNPAYKRDLEEQRGYVPPVRNTVIGEPGDSPKPSKGIFDQFKKD